jgi:collagenase-like PrtC family protease
MFFLQSHYRELFYSPSRLDYKLAIHRLLFLIPIPMMVFYSHYIAVPARVRYGSMVTARSGDQGSVLNACDHRYKLLTSADSLAKEYML